MVLQLILASKLSELEQFEIFWDPTFFWLTLYTYLQYLHWYLLSTIVVMLTKLREMGREKCAQYWPSDRSARYQYFVVDPLAEYNMPQYILREFKVGQAGGLSV